MDTYIFSLAPYFLIWNLSCDKDSFFLTIQTNPFLSAQGVESQGRLQSTGFSMAIVLDIQFLVT